ncbi:hypothetical protein RP726_08820 [Candidatus Methylospira mobilis]|nr:hypothetical protein [Candidatus Methylospira mobilis]WNV06492.1 hypothetical protein RP726_08820 [Candidatus Methylospira mobilis]
MTNKATIKYAPIDSGWKLDKDTAVKILEAKEPLINSQNLGCCAGAQFF